MVVVLVASMYILFLAIDAILDRRKRSLRAAETQARHAKLRESTPRFAAGYALPEDLHFHQGHTWLHWVSPEEAYVGVDDFGRRLIGTDSRVTPPNRGSWVHQGEHAAKVQHEGREVHLLSPVSGEVVGVNPDLKKDPSLINKDSYGRGWIFKIRAADLHQQISNLLSGSLAQRWMEDTRDRFQRQLMMASGSVIQDGGAPVDDVASQLDAAQWQQLAGQFFELQNSSSTD
jgi:glycine cleavage system H protein